MPEVEAKRHVRVELNPEDHKNLRLAAALRDQPMAEFAHDVVLEAVGKILTGVQMPAVASANSRRRRVPSK